MTLEGIDVSYAQTHTPSLVGKSFAFAKATEGTAVDPKYAYHMANFRTAGIVAGAYHFGLRGSVVTVAAQVSAFLNTAGSADLLALDVEGATPMTTTEAQAFINGVRAKGRKCGLYASRSGYPIAVNCDFRWIADYTGTVPNISWQFWQYTNKGTASGLDLDKFNGDQAALYALAGKDVPMRTFTITGQSGTVTVKGTGHALIPIDGSLRVPVADGTSLGIGLPIHLDKPYDTNPGDRQSAWLAYYGGKDVALLQSDGVIVHTPLPVTISVPGYLAGTVTLK